jgi:uncharacterized membrane protein
VSLPAEAAQRPRSRERGGGSAAMRAGFLRLAGFVRRAFTEFLAAPSAVAIAFLAAALATSWLDRRRFAALEPVRELLRVNLFADPKATSDLLGTVAGSVITVTSITISVLAVALQQSASSLTTAVFDQFLRRRVNQVYFGFFVGLSVFTLVILSTVSAADPPLNPVFGGSLALAATVVALQLLILLLYTTINQMRPAEIIDTIHAHVLSARACQHGLLARTRRSPRAGGAGAAREPVTAAERGFVTGLDLGAMDAALREAGAGAEIVLGVSLGVHRACGEQVAEVTAADRERAEALAEAVRAAVRLEPQRDVASDPAYGVEQLATIAWTSISSAKSDPAPGLLVIGCLHDLLVRFADEERERPVELADEAAAIVYRDDVALVLLDALEGLAVCSSQSMQPQSYAEVVRTLARSLSRLPQAWRTRVEDVALRILTALGDHVLTRPLESALDELAGALRADGRSSAADRVAAASDRLRRSLGELDSRATRAAH